MALEYRLYNKKEKKMEYSSIPAEEDTEVTVNIRVCDINGKEIYDGDILKTHDILGFVGYDTLEACYCIWIKDEPSRSFIRHSPGQNWHEWTIIGNKLENFDLLDFTAPGDEDESAIE